MATYKVCSPVPLNGLILYLDSLNLKSYPGTGSIWYDISGQENHFIIRGDIVYTPLRGFSNFIGNSGSIGNKIYSSKSSFAKALKVANGGTGYTTLVWAKSDGSGSFMKLLGFADGENYIDLYQNTSSPFGYRQEDGSTLYVDGISVNNNSYSLPGTGFHQLASTNLFGGNATPPTTSLTIGNEPDGSGAGTNAFAWTGSIAAVMMYNRVLTNGEIIDLNRTITQRYIAQGASPAPDPTMVIHLDAGNTGSYLGGNIWYDLSGNGNHAYKIDIPGITPTFSPSGSGSFDFPALTLGPSGGFTINDSPTIRNLNQASVELVFTLRYKDTFIGGDTDWMSIFSKDNGTRIQQRPAVSINQLNNGSNRFLSIETPVANNSAVNNINDFSGSVWYHVVATIGNTGTRAYVNTERVVNTTNVMVGNTNPIYIGTDSVTEMFKGNLAVVKFHNKELSALEVSSSFETYKTRFNLSQRGPLLLSLDAGLTASYPGTGTTWFDLTNRGNNVTLVNGVAYTGSNSGSFVFDGSNDYVNLTTNIQAGYTQASFEYIVRPSNLPTGNNYYQLYIQETSTWMALYNYSGFTFFGIDLNNGNGWFDNNGGFNTGARTTSTLSANTFYHVVYSWNGSTVSTYLNGNLESTVSTLQATNGRQNVTILGQGTTPRNIGSRSNGGSNNFPGQIPLVKFYGVALDSTAVLNNYNSLKTRFNLP
jgi:hypothetical protein